MLREIEQDISDSVQAAKKARRLYRDNKPEILAVAVALNAADIKVIRATIDQYDVNLSITGDFATLKAIFSVFRKLGYEPDNRPTEKRESTFWTNFSREGTVNFYLSFSSTVCKRVKVGTETREVDIYETVCE